MEDNNTYFGPTVGSDEDVEFERVLSGEVDDEKPLWIKDLLDKHNKGD